VQSCSICSRAGSASACAARCDDCWGVCARPAHTVALPVVSCYTLAQPCASDTSAFTHRTPPKKNCPTNAAAAPKLPAEPHSQQHRRNQRRRQLLSQAGHTRFSPDPGPGTNQHTRRGRSGWQKTRARCAAAQSLAV
jgi:hypothetical protein